MSHRGIRQERLDIPVGNKTTSEATADGDPWKGGVTPVIHITTTRLWEVGISTFHCPVRLQVLPPPEQALEPGQQLEKEVASNQVSRLDVELGLLAAVSAPLHLL